MASEMNRRGIRWSLPAEEAPGIQAHTTMLRQILVSIIANAIDVMPHGGNLAVLWHVESNALKLQVTDTGPGVPADMRNALFRPFFSTKSGGLGIGLALVRRMVEQWNGQVTLTPAPVQGTCVELTLPLANEQAQPLK
jgi:two-component system sensor histidine kinase HydH